jgi:hypothetical protein
MIYFITETYLKTQTPITANVDVNDVVPYIKTQSDMRVQPILGTYFYNYMLSGYNAQTLNGDEETLVTYIQPVVAWRSAEDAVFGLSYQLKNKGIQQQFGDYSNAVTQNEVSFSMEHYAQKASFFEQRLIRYLLANKNLYPLFTSQENRDTDLRPQIEQCNCVGTCWGRCGQRYDDNGYNNAVMVF